MTPSPYITTGELADLVRAPTSTVRYWRFKGTGPRSVKVGRHVLYLKAHVDAWLEEQHAASDTSSDRVA